MTIVFNLTIKVKKEKKKLVKNEKSNYASFLQNNSLH